MAEARSDLLHTGPIAIRGIQRATRDFFRPERANKHRASPEKSEGETLVGASACEDEPTSLVHRPPEQGSPEAETRPGNSTRTAAAFVRPASAEQDERAHAAQISVGWTFGSAFAHEDDVGLARTRSQTPTRRPMAYPAALDAGALEVLRRNVEAMAADAKQRSSAHSHAEPAPQRSLVPRQPSQSDVAARPSDAEPQGELGEVHGGSRRGEEPYETDVAHLAHNEVRAVDFVESAAAQPGEQSADAETRESVGGDEAVRSTDGNGGEAVRSPAEEPALVNGGEESTGHGNDQQLSAHSDEATDPDPSPSTDASPAAEAGSVLIEDPARQIDAAPEEPEDVGDNSSVTDPGSTEFSERPEDAWTPEEARAPREEAEHADEPTADDDARGVDEGHEPLPDYTFVSPLTLADSLDAGGVQANPFGVLSWPSRPQFAYEAVAAALETARVDPEATLGAVEQGNREQASVSPTEDAEPSADVPEESDERGTQEDPAAEQALDRVELSQERHLPSPADHAPERETPLTEALPGIPAGGANRVAEPEEALPSRDVSDAALLENIEVSPMPPQKQERAAEAGVENEALQREVAREIRVVGEPAYHGGNPASSSDEARAVDGSELPAEQSAAPTAVRASVDQGRLRPAPGSNPPRTPRPPRASRPPRFTGGAGGTRPWGYVAVAVLAVLCIALVAAVIVKTKNDSALAAKEASSYTPLPLDTPSAASRPPAPVVSVVGDELTTGISADSGAKSEWPALLQAATKTEVKTYATAGAGYVTKGSGGATLVTEAGEVDPSSAVVLIFGGSNDQPTADALAIATAATKAVSAAHARAPKAKIVLVGPASGLASPSASLTTISDALQAAAQAAGAQWVDPIAGHWLSSSPALTDAQGRPTDAGEKAIESKLQHVLENLV